MQVTTFERTINLPEDVASGVKSWIGVCELLYFWEQNGTYFVVVKSDLVYFLRLFKLNGEYVISQDHEYELKSEDQ